MKNQKTKILIALLFCTTIGCNTLQQDPRAELVAAQKTFAATVDSLTAMQKLGKFTPEEKQQLTVLIHQGQDYLEQWQVAVITGQARPDVIQIFQDILDKMIEYKISKGGD